MSRESRRRKLMFGDWAGVDVVNGGICCDVISVVFVLMAASDGGINGNTDTALRFTIMLLDFGTKDVPSVFMAGLVPTRTPFEVPVIFC